MATESAIAKLRLIQGGKSQGSGEFPAAVAVLIVAGVLIYIVVKNMEMPDAANS